MHYYALALELDLLIVTGVLMVCSLVVVLIDNTLSG